MSLQGLLETQLSALEQLEALLKQEQDALLKANVDGPALNELAEAKQACLQLIDRQEQLRRTGMHRLGHGDAPSDARAAAEKAGCLPQWAAVLESAQRVARLNTQNGSLLELRMKRNLATLRLLNEQAGKAQYNATGQLQRAARQLSSSA